MKCNKVKPLLPELLDGELAPAEAAQVQQHLDDCDDCARQRIELQRSLEAVDALSQLEPSEGFDAAFARKLQVARRSQRAARPEQEARPPRSWFQIWRMPLLATAGACAALLAVFVLRDPPPPAARPVPSVELAQNLNLLQDYDVVTNLDALEDFEVINELESLEEEL